jgi:ParB-like chromosome segregation protein Spo0J
MPLTSHPDPRPFHPLAALFPLMSEAEVATLADDIATHGLHMPIMLDRQGRIVDGRNRYHALQRLGLATAEAHYTTTDLDGDALVQYVVSLNLHRRHLNENQRALVAAKLANLAHGGDRKSSTDSAPFQAADLPLDLPPADVAMVMTQAEAAALLNVSARMVRDRSLIHS